MKQLVEDFGLKEEDFWTLPQNNSYILLHDACMRIAADAGVVFDTPVWLQSRPDHWALMLSGSIGEKTYWTTGEASPDNTKQSYPLAMAEKRAKDRLTLYLTGHYHQGIKSEIEAEAYEKPEDKVEEVEETVEEKPKPKKSEPKQTSFIKQSDNTVDAITEGLETTRSGEWLDRKSIDMLFLRWGDLASWEKIMGTIEDIRGHEKCPSFVYANFNKEEDIDEEDKLPVRDTKVSEYIQTMLISFPDVDTNYLSFTPNHAKLITEALLDG